jgi:PAS domain S-box-containing protein
MRVPHPEMKLWPVCSASLVTFSAVIGWVSVSHLLSIQEPSVGRILGIIAIVGVTIPLFAGGIWLRVAKESLTDKDVLRIVGWCVVGAFPLTIFGVLIFVYEGQHGVTLAEPFAILLWITGGGAVGGLVTGIYDVKRHKSHRRQRATADRLSALIEAAPVSIVEHEPDGTVRLWNRTAEQVFGWKAEEVIGGPLPFLSEEMRAEYESHRNRMQDGEQLTNIEVRRQTKGGERREFLLSTAPIYGEERDTIDSIIGVLVDVTEQKRCRQDLALFRTLLDRSNDSIFVVDPETGDIVDVNETASRKLGYDQEELLEQSVTDIEATLSTDREWNDHITTLREEGSVVFEGKHRCKDGSTFPVEVNIAHVAFDSDQEYTVAIARDVTDRKKREQKLRRFRKAVEQAGHAIYLTDEDGTIEYTNPAFEDITGYSSEEATGNDPSILQSGEHDEEYYRRLWITILDGEIWEESVTNRRKSGELYTARQTIAPIYDGDTIAGFVAVQSETTAQRMREQWISVLNRVLRHNLRTAVTVISGHADLLLRELENGELRTYANKIDEQARRLETLGEKAQAVKVALDSSQSPARSIPIDDMLEQVLKSCDTAGSKADISIESFASKSVLIDGRIRPALEELVENAIEHSDQACPTVRITTAIDRSAEQVSISVADNGPDIPDQERIVFQEGPETPLQHGSGIGMWLVEWITTALGGKAAIDDNEPRGNVVTITLPVVVESDDTSGEHLEILSRAQSEHNPHTSDDD